MQQLVGERVSVWGPLAAERGVGLLSTPGGSVYAWAVPGHLEQVLDNLLANCFDLEPPPTRVDVDVRTEVSP